jgi:lycopene beta-cyclase
VTAVAPSPTRRWQNRYGAWRDELPPDAPWVGTTWPTATLCAQTEHRWDRAYSAIDGVALQRALLERLQSAGGVVVDALAASATAKSVTLAQGETIAADIVVDATGSGGFARRDSPLPELWQTAWGAELQLPRGHAEPTGWCSSSMRLMDFSEPVLGEAPESGPPSFMYAMPFGEGRWFVEETVLVGPEVDFDVLKDRAVRRLSALGVAAGWERSAAHEERCRIPMDMAPVTKGEIFAFGAAAGTIHPATGYSVAHSLAMARPVAEALHHGGGSLNGAWQALWPADAIACDTLYRFGGEVLAGLTLPQTQSFFEAFAGLPDAQRDGYQSRRLDRGDLARTMWNVFGRTSWGIRRILTIAGTRRAPSLVSALFGSP